MSYQLIGSVNGRESISHGVLGGALRAEVPHWFAVHTGAQREKKVAGYLLQSGIEHFLPLYTERRRWKDRVVTIETPLFTGYLFVRIPLSDKLRVLNAPGVAKFVSQNGKPAVIPESDIERVKSGLIRGAIPHPYLTVGRRVEIVSGPLAGTTGILIRRKNNVRVVVSIHSISRAMAIEVAETDVRPVFPGSRLADSGV
jgi:transcription antitermination factor NusG